MAKQTIDELAVIITANAAKLPGDLAKAKKEFDKFVKDVQATNAPPPKPPDLRPLREAHKEAAAVRSAVRESSESVLGFVAKVAATGGTLVAFEMGLGGIAGAFNQLKESVKSAADYEQTALSFEVMLGSARRAQQMLGEIRQYAASTPFNTREITSAARQLVAYGFAAEKVMPTVKMLGDVSAGMGDAAPMEQLTYIYGTLRAQGRAYQRDMNQFTQRGIQIWQNLEAVMGKSNVELQAMLEDGRIGFADIEAAFQRMTSEGGRFYQMTARQGQTTAGVMEQMRDSFDLFKLELGKVLIEELGIKEGARDLEAFAKRLRENVGEIRPAVRYAGELARAGAQISYEFTRAGIAVGSMNLDALGVAFPRLKSAADAFHQLVIDAQNFKVDEDKLINFGMDAAEATMVTFATIAQTIKKLWEDAKDGAQPVLNVFKQIDDLSKRFEARGDSPAARDARDMRAAGQAAADGRVGDVFRNLAPGPMVFTNQRPTEVERIDNPDRLRAVYAGLSAEVRAAQAELARASAARQASPFPDGPTASRPFFEAQRRLEAANRARGEMVHGHFPGDAATLTALLDRGQVPPMHPSLLAPPSIGQDDAGRMALLGPAGLFPGQAKTFAQTAREAVAEMRATMLAANRQRREAEASAREAEANHRAVMVGALGPAGLFPSPFDADAADRQAARAAALGSIAAMPPREPVRPEVAQLGLDIRREYDPRPELDVLRRQLDEIGSRQLLGPNTNALVERAWRDRLGQAAGKLGIDQGRYQLPEATAVGSAEDARIINAWRTEGQRPTSDLIWQRIATAVETLVRIEEQRATRLPVAPMPRVVQLPGE